jgi:hypothetical protein
MEFCEPDEAAEHKNGEKHNSISPLPALAGRFDDFKSTGPVSCPRRYQCVRHDGGGSRIIRAATSEKKSRETSDVGSATAPHRISSPPFDSLCSASSLSSSQGRVRHCLTRIGRDRVFPLMCRACCLFSHHSDQTA